MLFNSATYLFLFLPLVFILYRFANLRLRQWIIFGASLVFYGFWRVEFIPLIIFSALIDYVIALRIQTSDNQKRRKKLLLISLVMNLGILGVFKYLTFFRDSLWSIAEMIGYQPSYVDLNIILPLGISFYIFQTMSYTIDVYRREKTAEKDLLVYICFVTFFPQLVAGPILRASEIIPQLKTRLEVKADDIISGIKRILGGLFMKVVLADSIATFVDHGFERAPETLSALDSWTLAFLFGFQIYFDFAGYSSIAIGSALLFGFKIRENFNYPYAATSPRNFWKRWHISLSSWIQEYIYLPMIGAYRSKNADTPNRPLGEGEKAAISKRRTWGLFLTWAIMGLWHGANWTFVLWGVYLAVLVYAYRLISPRITMPKGPIGWCLSVAITLPFIMASWIAFRAPSVMDTLTIWGMMINPMHFDSLSLSFNSYLSAAVLTLAFFLRYWWEHSPAASWGQKSVIAIPMQIIYHAVIIALVFLFLQVKSQFIYFQF